MNDIKCYMHKAFSSMDIKVSSWEIEKYIKYIHALNEYNKKINLTAITEEKEIIIKHFCDSLLCMKTGYIKNKHKIVDVGTGAGFPGVVLKIHNPEVEVTLVESIKKKVQFLKSLVSIVEINISIKEGRAEELGKSSGVRGTYDIAVARAVGKLSTLNELCLPFVKVGGYFLAMKGGNYYEELEESKKSLEVLGASIHDVYHSTLPSCNSKRAIIIIKKESKTPDQYPRRSGMPKKKPL